MTTTKKMNHYKILGVPYSASSKAISQAYRKLAMKHHPDKNLDDKADAETRFKMLRRAYETLIDPSKRREYDRTTGFQFQIFEDTTGYDVEIDEFGVIIHSMYLHNLTPLDEAFQSSNSPNSEEAL